MQSIDVAFRSAGLWANIEELGQFGRIEITESLNDDAIVISELNSKIDLVFVGK